MPKTQTPGPLTGSRDPNPDQELTQTQTPDAAQTQTATQTQTGTQTQTQTLRGLGLGLDGPDETQTENQTQTETQTRTPGRPAIGRHAARSGSGSRSDETTETETETQTENDPAVERPTYSHPRYPGGRLAQGRARRAARRAAEDEAIARGAVAELILLEARTELELEDDDEPSGRWEKFAAGWPQLALAAAVSIMASVGQIQFAKTVGATGMIWLFGHDITPYFAPAVFDLSVAGLYSRGMYVAIKFRASPWLAWIAGTAVGLFSVYTNTQHRGGLFFAPASAVLLISWLVSLIYKYMNLPHVRTRRATAKPRILTSSLVLASWPTATRAWVIARRRSITAATVRLAQLGERIGERDLLVAVAELYNTVYADRVIAETEALGDPPAADSAAARRAWKTKLRQAREKAALVAWDAVDDRLGLAVIRREGIQVNRVTYLEPVPQPVQTRLPASPARRAIETVATPAAGTALVPSRRTGPVRPAAVGPRVGPGQVDEQQPEMVILAAGQPTGPAGKMWLPVGDIPGLPFIPDGIVCKCGPDPQKWCTRTLDDHTQRLGRYLEKIFAAIEDWDRRPARPTKAEIKAICEITGGDTIQKIGWVIGQLRELEHPGVEVVDEES